VDWLLWAGRKRTGHVIAIIFEDQPVIKTQPVDFSVAMSWPVELEAFFMQATKIGTLGKHKQVWLLAL